jgi:hypothetical protein
MKIPFLALIMVVITMAAGCTATSSGQPQTNSTVTSAGQDQASPYSQPLMATGGDLVMLRIVTRGIAG